VLDPFAGTGTLAVAERLGHDWLGMPTTPMRCPLAVLETEQEQFRKSGYARKPNSHFAERSVDDVETVDNHMVQFMAAAD
jgi:DNA modification methylase